MKSTDSFSIMAEYNPESLTVHLLSNSNRSSNLRRRANQIKFIFLLEDELSNDTFPIQGINDFFSHRMLIRSFEFTTAAIVKT